MFIYCNNEMTKETLLQAGFKFITEREQKGEQKVWVFEFDESIPLPDLKDKNTFYMSKKMSF